MPRPKKDSNTKDSNTSDNPTLTTTAKTKRKTFRNRVYLKVGSMHTSERVSQNE